MSFFFLPNITVNEVLDFEVYHGSYAGYLGEIIKAHYIIQTHNSEEET